MIFASGRTAFTPDTIRRCRFDRPAPEAGIVQHSGPCIEDLYRIRARIELANEIADGRCNQLVNEPLHQIRIAIGSNTGSHLILGRVPGNRIAGNRPGRPTEAEQCCFRGQFRSKTGNRLYHRFEMILSTVLFKLIDKIRRQRFQNRATSFFKPNRIPDGVRNDEDVGKQNARIKTITADRLESDLCCQVRRVAEFEEVGGFGTDLPGIRADSVRLDASSRWEVARSFLLREPALRLCLWTSYGRAFPTFQILI
jgi:hypothetical protein